MYYHQRPLKYVAYDKVDPPPLETIDPYFANAYRWLGHHCGFFPQVWLSRSRSHITGFRLRDGRKLRMPDGVLFGFESIQGFPVDYDLWCEFLGYLMISEDLNQAEKWMFEWLDKRLTIEELQDDQISKTWRETKSVETILTKHLFIKNDQVVVPSLNLKAAKSIICKDEQQKKELRRMGFINDRITIRGV